MFIIYTEPSLTERRSSTHLFFVKYIFIQHFLFNDGNHWLVTELRGNAHFLLLIGSLITMLISSPRLIGRSVLHCKYFAC